MKDWFTLERLDEDSFVLSEYRHWEEPHAYLLRGRERSLLIDTGLGVGDMAGAVWGCTDGPVTAVLTHAHWDHTGGLGAFPDFGVHAAEREWLRRFPLPAEAVRRMLCQSGALPEDFDAAAYTPFQGEPTQLLEDGQVLDLGGRRIQVLHTPGHSPGHLCFWEGERGWLFSGDLLYLGTLCAHYPSTDPGAYRRSLERVAGLPLTRVLPGHHRLDVPIGLAEEACGAFRALEARGQLRHGAGTFSFGDWALQL